jgi:hypothetical protein
MGVERLYLACMWAIRSGTTMGQIGRIPGQKSYIRGCQVRNTPRRNARNNLLTSSPLQAAELRCFVLPVVSWFAFMTALFGFLKLTS